MLARSSQATQTEPAAIKTDLNVNPYPSGSYYSGSISQSGLISPFLTSSCCPLSAVHQADNSLFNFEYCPVAFEHSKSLRSSIHCDLNDNVNEISKKNINSAVLSDVANLVQREQQQQLQQQQQQQLQQQQQQQQQAHQHRFIVRTIPGFLSLSPRASYHRLSFRGRRANIEQHLTSVYDSGDTILLCCPVTASSETLWHNEDHKKSQASLVNDSTFDAKHSLVRTKPLIPPKPKFINKTCSIQSRYAEELSRKILQVLEDANNLRQKQMSKSFSEHVELVHSRNITGLQIQINNDHQDSDKEVDDEEGEYFPPPPSSANYSMTDEAADFEVATINANSSKTPLTRIESNPRSMDSNEYFLGIGPGCNSFNSSYYSSALYQCEHKSFSESELYVQMKENFNSEQNIKTILAKELNRCHSAIADLAVSELEGMNISLPPPSLTPPPSSATFCQLQEAIFGQLAGYEPAPPPPPGFEDIQEESDDEIDEMANVKNQSQQQKQHRGRHHSQKQTPTAAYYKSLSYEYSSGTTGSSGSGGEGRNNRTGSPSEEEHSSLITSVTNCSELLATSTTMPPTLSSETATIESNQMLPSSDANNLTPPSLGSISGQEQFQPKQQLSGHFHSPQLLQSGQLVLGGYTLDFDDDDDGMDDDDEEAYEDEDGHNQMAQNPDYAVAEGSSQDEEERARYDNEFETEEDEGEPIEEEAEAATTLGKKLTKIEPPVAFRGVRGTRLSDSDILRPSTLTTSAVKTFPAILETSESSESTTALSAALNKSSSSSGSRLKEGDKQLLASSQTAGTSRVTSKSLPENLYKETIGGDCNVGTIGNGSRTVRTIDSRRRTTLMRTKSSTIGRRSRREREEDEENDDDDFFMTSRFRPKISGSVRVYKHALGVSLSNYSYHSVTDEETNRGHQRFSSEASAISGGDRSDSTPIQDICSSDPSTAVDLSSANTVIERHHLSIGDYCYDDAEEEEETDEYDKEEEEEDEEEFDQKRSKSESNDENDSDEIVGDEEKSFELENYRFSSRKHRTKSKSKKKQSEEKHFSKEIFDQLNINDNVHARSSLDTVQGGDKVHGSRTRYHQLPVRQASEDQLSSSRGEDVPLLGGGPSNELSRSILESIRHLPSKVPLTSTTTTTTSGSESSLRHKLDDTLQNKCLCEKEFNGSKAQFQQQQQEQQLSKQYFISLSNGVLRPESKQSSSSDGSISPDGFGLDDSTTSGSFMLDEPASSTTTCTTDQQFRQGEGFSENSCSQEATGLTTSLTAANTTNEELSSEMANNRRNRSMGTYQLKLSNDDDHLGNKRPTGSNSLPCMNYVVKQVGGQTPSELRAKFEKRQQGRRHFATTTKTKTETTELELSDSTDLIFQRYQQILNSESKQVMPVNHISLTGYNNGNNISNNMAAPIAHDRTGSKGSKGFALVRQSSQGQPQGYQQHQQQQQQQHHQQMHGHQLLPQQHTNNAEFEQNSQATERDLERSEFSLQHQNSELDDEESLTFENLNNQSLSVIDEDSKGLSEEAKADRARQEEFAERQTSRCLSDAFANVSKQLQKLSLEKSFDESKDHNFDIVSNEFKVDDDKDEEAFEKKKKFSRVMLETALDEIEDEQLVKLPNRVEQTTLTSKHQPSLGIQSKVSGGSSETVNSRCTLGGGDISKTLRITHPYSEATLTDDPSSNEIGLLRYRGVSGYGDAETEEQLAERVALLDSSDHTTHSNVIGNQQRFNQKLAEIQAIMMKGKTNDMNVGKRIESNKVNYKNSKEEIFDENEDEEEEEEAVAEEEEEEEVAAAKNILSQGESSEHQVQLSQNETFTGGTTRTTTEETVTYSTTSAALSECSSSLVTPDYSAGNILPFQHKTQIVPILKHRSSSHRYCYDPHCYQTSGRHHSSSGRRSKLAGVAFADSPPSINGSLEPMYNSTGSNNISNNPSPMAGTGAAVQHCCARCYYRHHHGDNEMHHHHRMSSSFLSHLKQKQPHQTQQPQVSQTLASGGNQLIQAEVHYYQQPSQSHHPHHHHHHHHHHHRRSQQGISSSSSASCRLCHPHYHHHHHPMVAQHQQQYYSSQHQIPIVPMNAETVSDTAEVRRHSGDLLDQARARSLTRCILTTTGQETEHANTLPRRRKSDVRKEEVAAATSENLANYQTRINDNTSEDASDPDQDQTPTGSTGALATSQTPPERRSPCNQHYFTCSYCGETTMPPGATPIICQSRYKKKGMPTLTRKSFTIEDVYFDEDDEENDIGVHSESYRSYLWIYIGRREELTVWGSRNRQTYRQQQQQQQIRPTSGSSNISGSKTLANDTEDSNTQGGGNSIRSESEESTISEKIFRKNYENVTHRLIHRKASIELYRRILDRTFAIDKCLTLVRDNNEFGFRIHGSRPVVVSAVEKGTSAEHKGLGVGDIIVSVNGVNVLDLSHSDVVKLAHTGSNKLTLEVASTSASFKNDNSKEPTNEPKVIINGYLKRFVDKLADQYKSQDKMTNTHLWRRRWFVLKSDACLYWYRNPKSIEPIGAISLQGYCASVINECLFGQEYLFRLVGFGTSPVKYFAAIDHETALQWVKALNQNSVRYNNSDAFIELTLHNIHRNPLTFLQPDCYGFLAKFNQIKSSWKQRYFVLKDGCLYFYADANSNTALGLFYLHGYKVQSCSMLGKRYSFELIPPNTKFRHIWLCADSDADKKRWLAALEYSIDRWIRLK